MVCRTNFFTIRCQNDHRLVTDEFSTIQEATQAIFNPHTIHHFTRNHQQCGRINSIPIKGLAHITVHCTDCHYLYKFTSMKKPTHLDQEFKWATHSLQKGLYRKILKTVGRCFRLNCQLCQSTIKDNSVTDPIGTTYILPTFRCNIKNCIYVL